MPTPERRGCPWTHPDWFAPVRAWVNHQLDRLATPAIGPITEWQPRPWSIVLHVPTTAGVHFFKATAPALAYEPALTHALSRWQAGYTPPVLALDPARGWLLLPDLRPRLRELLRGPEDLAEWERILPRYAALQIALHERGADLLAVGVPDRRLARLPDHYRQLLASPDRLQAGHPSGLTPAELERLRDLMPTVTAACAELAAYGIPETLHHDDFHDGNIYLPDGQVTFADWGEACLTHPFFSLVVGLRSIADRFAIAPDAPAIRRLRAAYLEPWERFAPRRDLEAASGLALRLGTLCRALTWHTVLAPLDSETRAPYADAVPGWLQEFLARA